MKAILSFLFISTGVFATGSMPAGHSQHKYYCTIPGNLASPTDPIPPKGLVLSHHIGCFWDSMAVTVVERNGTIHEKKSCTSYAVPGNNKNFYGCDEEGDLTFDALNETGTWTTNGMTYQMECMAAID